MYKKNNQMFINMHHTHIGVFNAEIIRSNVILSIALTSKYTLREFHDDCNRMGINVLECKKLGGLLTKKYMFGVEGMRINVQRLGSTITMY